MARTSVTVQKDKVILYQVNEIITFQRDDISFFENEKHLCKLYISEL